MYIYTGFAIQYPTRVSMPYNTTKRFFLHCIRCVHETSIASHCPGICFYINEYLLKCLYTPDKRLKAGLERKKEENETSRVL